MKKNSQKDTLSPFPSPAEHSTPLSFGEGHGGEAVEGIGGEAAPAEHSTPLSLGEGQGGEAVEGIGGEAVEGIGGEAVILLASSPRSCCPLV